MTIAINDIITYFATVLFPRLEEFVNLPINEPSILWTILPLLVTAFFLEIYFGRYKTEELGWNSAFANCVSLLWVTSSLMRFMFENYGMLIFTEWNIYGQITPLMLMIAGFGLWSLALALCNFFHILPRWIAFFVSSTIPVNGSAVILTIIVIGKLPLDRVTAFAALIAFVALAIFFSTIQAIVWPSAEAKKYIEDYKKKAEKIKEQREQKIHQKIHIIKERIIAQYKATVHTIKEVFRLRKKGEKP